MAFRHQKSLVAIWWLFQQFVLWSLELLFLGSFILLSYLLGFCHSSLVLVKLLQIFWVCCTVHIFCSYLSQCPSLLFAGSCLLLSHPCSRGEHPPQFGSIEALINLQVHPVLNSIISPSNSWIFLLCILLETVWSSPGSWTHQQDSGQDQICGCKEVECAAMRNLLVVTQCGPPAALSIKAGDFTK